MTMAEYDAEWDLDRSWHEYDYWTWDDECEYRDIPASLARFELDVSIDRFLCPAPPLVDLPSSQCVVTPGQWQGVRSDELMQELEQQKAMLEGLPTEGTITRLWRVLSEPGVPEALREIKARFPDSTTVNWVCKFATFWIRSPVDFQGRDFRSLIEHLFVLYHPPAFLDGEWSRKEPHFKWLCWFIVLGQGGDLKQAAKRFGWAVPRRLIQFLYDAPASLHPPSACVYAEIRRCGGEDIDALRVLRNPAFVMDPTEPGDAAHAVFWKDTICWLIEHRKRLSDAEADLILSWAMHEFTECRTFAMRGRSPRACLERSQIYHEELARPWAQFLWNPHGWDLVIADAEGTRWTFEELTSGTDLYDEGQSLRHCVASYAARCAAGYSAIISMKRNGARCITLEINPRNRTLAQARGLCNRDADKTERAMIGEWLTRVVNQRIQK